ncbi:hypothetical protein Dimus_010891 [Dionaea muscipula]
MSPHTKKKENHESVHESTYQEERRGGGGGGGEEEEEEMEEAHIEDVVEENPKDDTHDGISRGEDLDKIENDVAIYTNVDIKENPPDDILIGNAFVEEVLKEITASIEVDDDADKDEQSWVMVVYQGPVAKSSRSQSPVAESSHLNTSIHAHKEQAVKCNLEGMDQQNKGIKELSERLESKIFTDNQKERLTNVNLREIKTYLDKFSNELNNLAITLKRTMLQVDDLVSEKIKDQSTILQHKVEESRMDLKHLIEQKFLEHDIRLQSIEETVNDVSKS